MGGLAVSTALWIQAEQAKALAVGAQAMAEEARAHAEIEEQRANEHLSKYERLADVRILQELRDQAPQDLWPRRPEQADSMLAWLEIAEKLRDNRSHHQATLAQLLDSSTSDTSESPEFASNKQAWHYEVLNGLLVDLQHFSSEQGLYRVALKNLEVAHSVEQRTLRDHEAEWEEAIFAIQESSHYHGLEISMQIGLVPLGEDPETGLWEFWLWESGQRPRRDSESGRWQMDAEVGMILVLLPSGSFTLGATAASDRLAQEYEKPLRTLSLPAFLISKYEMTQGQWLRTRGENPSYYHPENTNVLVTSHLGHPVETVSWLECMETVHSLGLDLPTEAQWEYAARAGTRTIWSSGDDPQSLRLVANLADAFAARHGGPPEWSYDSWDDGFAGHAPVGKLEPNPFGLHDVHGNVSEWCRDAFGVYSLPTVGEDALREVSGGDTRVYRGGSLATTAQLSRSACRQHNRPEFRVYDLGLRPIRALQR
jgi:formylglycine-generating enzyme required for sulfatase activity